MSGLTDRELLEGAARAIDLHGEYSERANAIVNEDGYWMPQNDYGDALRLAEALGIFVGKSATGSGVYFASRNDLEGLHNSPSICKAITRAAHAIGVAMDRKDG